MLGTHQRDKENPVLGDLGGGYLCSEEFARFDDMGEVKRGEFLGSQKKMCQSPGMRHK